MTKHKWEWAKGGATGQKQCVKCGMDKFPGHVFQKPTFYMGRKLVAEGKTPPCEPKPKEGAPYGNKNALKGKARRKVWNGYLDLDTIAKLKQMAADSGLSQGEIIDQLVAGANLKDLKTG